MSLPHRIAEQKRSDAELERTLGITKNDPVEERYGRKRYSRDDIATLEWEKIGRAWREWRKRHPS